MFEHLIAKDRKEIDKKSFNNGDFGRMIRKTINVENIQRKEDIKALISVIMKKYSTGGALHIVIDDGNLDDQDIMYCIEALTTNKKIEYPKEDINIFLQCSSLLLQLSYSARVKLISTLQNSK